MKLIIRLLLVLSFCFIISSSYIGADAGKIMYTVRSSVTLHTEATNDSSTVAVPYMTELVNYGSVTNSDSGSWLKIGYDNKIYYLWAKAGVDYLTNTRSTFVYDGIDEYRQDVIDKALYICNNWDTKYEHGQSNGIPDADGKYGFDCSGFVNYVLGTVMREYIPVYRLSANIEKLHNMTAIYNIGTESEFSVKSIMTGRLNKEDLVPGDIIFFMLGDDPVEIERGYDHCGIYLGNNEFIHSTTSWGGGVCIMPLSDIYVDGFVSVKRYLPDVINTTGETLYTLSTSNKIYPEMDVNEEPLIILDAEEPLEVIFTNDNWAYVEYEDGKKGFILLNNLGEKPEELSEKYFVAKTSLKLYKDHTTDSDYVEVLIGTELEYKGRYSTSNYYNVVYNGKEYYIYAPNGLTEPLTKDYDTLMEGIGTVEVLVNTNLRSSMNTDNDSNVISKAYAGEEFTLIAQSDSGTWCYVRDADGEYGFLLSNKLEIEISLILGDVNKDQKINAADALLVLKKAATLIEFDSEQSRTGDLTKDGIITALDALEILKIAAGIK